MKCWLSGDSVARMVVWTMGMCRLFELGAVFLCGDTGWADACAGWLGWRRQSKPEVERSTCVWRCYLSYTLFEMGAVKAVQAVQAIRLSGCWS